MINFELIFHQLNFYNAVCAKEKRNYTTNLSALLIIKWPHEVPLNNTIICNLRTINVFFSQNSNFCNATYQHNIFRIRLHAVLHAASKPHAEPLWLMKPQRLPD